MNLQELFQRRRKRVFFCLFALVSTILLATKTLPNVGSLMSFVSTHPKKVILWTAFWGSYEIPEDKISKCLYKCTFTRNRDELLTSDAVLFCDPDLNINDLPKYRTRDQRWVWFTSEPPQHTSSHLDRLEGLINWTMTQRNDSDIRLYPQAGLPAYEPRPINESLLQTKFKMAAWFVSKCKTHSKRETYVTELSKVVDIDIYGACGNLTCMPRMGPQCYEMAERTYYFYLSFENNICKEYITEKLQKPLRYNIVPVVLGGGDYASEAPPNSYIDALSFESPFHLGKYLKFLVRHPSEYMKYLKWKENYTLEAKESYVCALCRKLHRPFDEPPGVHTNLKKWYIDDARCTSWDKLQNKTNIQ